MTGDAFFRCLAASSLIACGSADTESSSVAAEENRITSATANQSAGAEASGQRSERDSQEQSPAPAVAENTDEADWRVRCSLRLSGLAVGWGTGYRCAVTEVLSGDPPAEDFSFLVAVGEFPSTPWPESRLEDGTLVSDYVFMDLAFRRDPSRHHGPPSGFRGEEHYWVLSDANHHDSDTCPNPNGHICEPGHWRLGFQRGD